MNICGKTDERHRMGKAFRQKAGAAYPWDKKTVTVICPYRLCASRAYESYYKDKIRILPYAAEIFT